MEILPRNEILTRDELIDLVKTCGTSSVSIYMPTSWVGAEVQQNQIRFKNLLKEAQEKLVSSGLRTSEAEEILAPAHGLLRKSPFWKKQNSGLAAFLAPGIFRYFRLPLDFSELLVVSDRFHLKPLLPLFSSGGKYYVLAISQKQVRFFQGLRNCFMELDLKGIPKSLAEAIKFDVPERHLRSRPRAAKGTAAFHGHGTWTDETKDNIMRYFQQVDRGLQEFLREERSPLIFAGVEYLFSMYREVNSYAHLMEKSIAGNPEGIRPDEFCKQAWIIAQSHYRKAIEEALDQYRQSVGTGLTSNRVDEIVPAAYHGRVGFLFAAKGQKQWGSFDEQSDKTVLLEKQEPGSEDLVDLAAIYTFLNAGTVYELQQENMPADSPVLAALYRY
ncbi:MAG: hypothetical protein ACE14T_05250 [Syntrophales bacterium]